MNVSTLSVISMKNVQIGNIVLLKAAAEMVAERTNVLMGSAVMIPMSVVDLAMTAVYVLTISTAMF